MKALAKKPGGLTRTELLAAAGLPSGGTATERLGELAESGFIQMSVPFGKREKDVVIRLADEFSLFHHAWIAPLGRKSADDGHWLKQRGVPRWRAWSGYAFEGACLKHTPRIKAALGIGGVQTTESPWRHTGSDAAPGAQIDLLIDRADGTISICEMKFSEGPFTIDKSYAAELRQKRDTFRRITGTRKSLFLTMVTTFGVVENAYAKELVTNSVLADELFRG